MHAKRKRSRPSSTSPDIYLPTDFLRDIQIERTHVDAQGKLIRRYHDVLRSPRGKLFYVIETPGKAPRKKYLTALQTARCLDGDLAGHKGGACSRSRSKRK